MHLTCTNCCLPSAAEVSGPNNQQLGDLNAYPLSLNQHGFEVLQMWPEPPKPKIPEHLPDEVARAYISAERNFAEEEMEEASAGSFGRALDIGTKIIAPDIDKMLYGRIKELAEKHRLTPELAEWAHEIRLIRNYAMHEIDATTREELIAIRGFAEMVLTYLFTLPGMLKARKADAAAADGSTTPKT